nr:glycosyltransferasein [uncultured bacterium]
MEKIAVGVATRNRPRMFAHMLESFLNLKWPDDSQIEFIFLENNHTLQIQNTVEDFKEKLFKNTGNIPHIHTTAVESRHGIPFVRNRILDIALDKGCDYLAFCDDDQTVNSDYLVELVRAAKVRSLDLVGSIARVETSSSASDLTFFQKLVYNELRSHQEKQESHAIRLHTAHKDQDWKPGSGAMLCRLDFLRQHRIRFNESLRYSHCEDLDFYYQVKTAGGQTGCAPRAIVYEVMPESRLSPTFQFKRHKNLTLARQNIRYAWGVKEKKVIRLSCTILGKLILGISRICLAPFNRGRSFTRGVRVLGGALGRLQSLLGHEDKHYVQTDGN